MTERPPPSWSGCSEPSLGVYPQEKQPPCAHCEELTRELAERDRELEDMGVRLDQARAVAARLGKPGVDLPELRELRSYLEFPPGWDGYSAPRFSRDTVDKAILIVEAIYSAFDGSVTITPGPCPDASIELEVESDALTATISIDDSRGRTASTNSCEIGLAHETQRIQRAR
jgi:hypothetical protein